MYVIDYGKVIGNKSVIKRFPQGRGVGVPRFLGEEKEKKYRKKGPGTSE
jgi:hypothetical protein